MTTINLDLLCVKLDDYGTTSDDIGGMITGGLGDCQHYNGKPQMLSRYPNINYNTTVSIYKFTKWYRVQFIHIRIKWQ